MPWKAHPKTGMVLGTLLTGDGLTPVDGAAVTATGRQGRLRRTAESDGNGWFAFPSLPPGAYRVTAVWATGRQEWDTRVVAGSAARLTAIQPDTAVSVPQVAGLGERPEGAQVILDTALVTSGSDRLGDHFFVADGFGETPLQVDAPRLVPPTIMGDRVVAAGTLHHTPTGLVLQASAVRVIGMEIVRAK